MSQINPPTEQKPKTEKFVLRLPIGMRTKIADIAKKNRRSMNSQIIFELEELIENDRLLAKEKHRDELTELTEST